MQNVIATHMLASLGGTSADTAPHAYVSKLFDDYSSSFEESLESLHYVVPSLISDAMQKLNPYYRVIADLVCEYSIGVCSKSVIKSPSFFLYASP